jgi:predicted metallo-beta-lactamase superfamily hydrolase
MFPNKLLLSKLAIDSKDYSVPGENTSKVGTKGGYILLTLLDELISTHREITNPNMGRIIELQESRQFLLDHFILRD